MSDTCETVKIVSDTAPDGYIVINAEDFDPAVHKAYEPQPEGDQSSQGDGAPAPAGRGAKSKAKTEA